MASSKAVKEENAGAVEKGLSSSVTPSSSWQALSFRKKIILISISIMVAVALALGLGLGLGLGRNTSPGVSAAPSTSATPGASADIVKPGVGITWDYPLGFNLTAENARDDVKFYGVDLANTDESDIAALKAAGHYIACYFSAGSWEVFRDDLDSVPPAAIGNSLDGWPGEKWFDTRNREVRNVMRTRIALAQTKGCNGVDADNIDGFLEDNDSGFDLTEDDGINYVQFLAEEAHSRSLAYGLKNGGDILDQVVGVSDWVINEQCAEFTECETYKPFIDDNKPVFHVEYWKPDDSEDVDPSFKQKSCAADGVQGFSTIIKHEPLNDTFLVFCD